MFVFMKMSFYLWTLNREHIHQYPPHNLHTFHPCILPNSFSLPLYQLAQITPLFCPLLYPNKPLTFPQLLPPLHPHPALPYCHQLLIFSNDHYAGTGSPSPDALAFSFDVVEQPISVAALPVSVTQTSPSTASPAGLQLYVDLSSYALQQLLGIGSPSP